jgi:hypothetical protein
MQEVRHRPVDRFAGHAEHDRNLRPSDPRHHPNDIEDNLFEMSNFGG